MKMLNVLLTASLRAK